SLTGAGSKRRAEFSAGRHLARRIGQRLGHPIAALPRRDDGAPAWPSGLLGSISHCDDLCVVALAPATRLRGLGVDIEPNRPIERELWPELFTPEERLWLDRDRTPGVDSSRFAFSAKESYYKAFAPPDVHSFLDLQVETDGLGFRVVDPVAPISHRLSVRPLGRWLLTTCSA
ncbi:MAG: 4'-phosphopantetheinyl transferase superfamily protein, partial [Acidobacteriota bacterium]